MKQRKRPELTRDEFLKTCIFNENSLDRFMDGGYEPPTEEEIDNEWKNEQFRQKYYAAPKKARPAMLNAWLDEAAKAKEERERQGKRTSSDE